MSVYWRTTRRTRVLRNYVSLACPPIRHIFCLISWSHFFSYNAHLVSVRRNFRLDKSHTHTVKELNLRMRYRSSSFLERDIRTNPQKVHGTEERDRNSITLAISRDFFPASDLTNNTFERNTRKRINHYLIHFRDL